MNQPVTGTVKISPDVVWRAWQQSQSLRGGTTITNGAKGFLQGNGNKKIAYKIIDVIPGKTFSLVCGSRWIRIVFIHKVVPLGSGSQIEYNFRIEGFWGWAVRWVLNHSIRANLSAALQDFVSKIG